MKRQTLIDQTTTLDGKEILLYERDGVYTIRVDGLELMSSRAHGSEEAMARLALDEVDAARPRVLVGGLGMGFTLRAVLDELQPAGRVTVAELLPAVVRWNRDHIGHLADEPLDDPRVTLIGDDVARIIATASRSFDAILLDVDNGPAALTDRRNRWLYSPRGLTAARRSLAAGGILAVWSASPDRRFERTLARAGFQVRIETVSARAGAKGPRHTIFVARRG